MHCVSESIKTVECEWNTALFILFHECDSCKSIAQYNVHFLKDVPVVQMTVEIAHSVLSDTVIKSAT